MKPHVEAIKEKVEKLKWPRAIKEVFFPEWLANTVVVKERMESAEFVLISLTLIEHVQRTFF